MSMTAYLDAIYPSHKVDSEERVKFGMVGVVDGGGMLLNYIEHPLNRLAFGHAFLFS